MLFNTSNRTCHAYAYARLRKTNFVTAEDLSNNLTMCDKFRCSQINLLCYTEHGITDHTVPALSAFDTVTILSKSVVKTAAASPYVVAFALLTTSSTVLNFKSCCTGPKI